jgi:hypothetical protein
LACFGVSSLAIPYIPLIKIIAALRAAKTAPSLLKFIAAPQALPGRQKFNSGPPRASNRYLRRQLFLMRS